MFAEDGFASTGVREIAQEAGVNPALVIRHFGSKEALFIETVTFPTSWRDALAGPIEDLGRRLVTLVAGQRNEGLKVWAALIRASDRPGVGQTFRDSITFLFADSVAARLDFPDAELRAHIFAAQFEGLLTALSVREDSVLLGLPMETLVERYGTILQRTLTGT